MPKRNDKVFCVNHPEEELVKFDGQYMLNRAEMEPDGKYYHQGTVFVGYLFVCDICQYTEIYSIPASPGVGLRGHGNDGVLS